jgi:hypothetical protein
MFVVLMDTDRVWLRWLGSLGSEWICVLLSMFSRQWSGQTKDETCARRSFMIQGIETVWAKVGKGRESATFVACTRP